VNATFATQFGGTRFRGRVRAWRPNQSARACVVAAQIRRPQDKAPQRSDTTTLQGLFRASRARRPILRRTSRSARSSCGASLRRSAGRCCTARRDIGPMSPASGIARQDGDVASCRPGTASPLVLKRGLAQTARPAPRGRETVSCFGIDDAGTGRRGHSGGMAARRRRNLDRRYSESNHVGPPRHRVATGCGTGESKTTIGDSGGRHRLQVAVRRVRNNGRTQNSTRLSARNLRYPDR
jgi:hypothetical protein